MSAETAKKPAKKASKAKSTEVKAVHYDIIRAPVITEKSTMMSEQNKVMFHISVDATKGQIKGAIEALFGVKVEKVNTINIRGKEKNFRGRPGRRSDVRKAVVTLAAGQSIDFAAGVK